ncbi:MAG: hypothetical protein PHP59_04950 [Methanofollis sp.]|uniref:DUF7524 family protein n=1 Tax=Methanofollis sp. TaxID=2052835 RepID=UPI0026295928|nr:hypothetical protein [Methanofollis sp.]MDD4254707.1 hypothetical protein [Methanofollis sp.]
MDVSCEIRLNTRGINSIDLPEPVSAAPGDTVLIRLVNEGSPLHLTLSAADAGRFTDFCHENLFVDTTAEVPIFIRKDVFPGAFDIEVITGYGTNRARLGVAVSERPKPPAEEPPLPAPVAAEPRLPVIPFAVVAAAALLFIIYAATKMVAFEAAAFIVLVAGVLAAWFLRP